MMQMNLQIDQSEVAIAQPYKEGEPTQIVNEAADDGKDILVSNLESMTLSEMEVNRSSPYVSEADIATRYDFEGRLGPTVCVDGGLGTNRVAEKTIVVGPIDGRHYSSPVSPRPDDEDTASVDSTRWMWIVEVGIINDK